MLKPVKPFTRKQYISHPLSSCFIFLLTGYRNFSVDFVFVVFTDFLQFICLPDFWLALKAIYHFAEVWLYSVIERSYRWCKAGAWQAETEYMQQNVSEGLFMKD